MKILQSRVKAAETAHFKPEMEDQILRRRDQLIKEGQIQNLTMPSVRSSVDTLPEILSHQLPLNLSNRQSQQVVNSAGYTVARPSQSAIAKFASDFSRPSIYDSLGSKELRSARDKWSSHTLDGKSIFDVNAAQDLMLEEHNAKKAAKKARLVNVGAKPPPPPVLRVGGVPLLLLPEPTAGRALLWGTVLAVWAGSAAASFTCNQLDINSASDVAPKFREALEPLAAFFHSAGSGVRTKVVNGDLTMDTSSFSYKLRETMTTSSR